MGGIDLWNGNYEKLQVKSSKALASKVKILMISAASLHSLCENSSVFSRASMQYDR